MTESHELKITFSDFASVAVCCPECGAEVVADLRDERQGRMWSPEAGLSCAVCHVRFSEKVKETLVRLAEAFRAAQSSGVSITFRVPMVRRSINA